MNQFLLLLNRMTARILARNTVTCCQRLSRECFGDVLHNIFAKGVLTMTIAQIRVVLTSLDTRGYIENHRQRTGEG